MRGDGEGRERKRRENMTSEHTLQVSAWITEGRNSVPLPLTVPTADSSKPPRGFTEEEGGKDEMRLSLGAAVRRRLWTMASQPVFELIPSGN